MSRSRYDRNASPLNRAREHTYLSTSCGQARLVEGKMDPDESCVSLAPTAFLPPVRRQPTLQALQDSLAKLRRIYGTRPPAHRVTVDASDTDARADERLEELRSDPHEKQYTLSWLNKLLDSQLSWLDAADAVSESTAGESSRASHVAVPAIPHAQQSGVQPVLQSIAELSEHLISADSQSMGLSDDEPMERVFCFPFDYERPNAVHAPRASSTSTQSADQRQDIEIMLVDAPLPPSKDDESKGANEGNEPAEIASSRSATSTSLHASTAVGVQTWAAAIILSDMLVRTPAEIHPVLGGIAAVSEPLRVAELGAGTGLVGVACAKILRRMRETPGARLPASQRDEVVLTDYHSLVLDNLRANVAANFAGFDAKASVDVQVETLDWSHYLQDTPEKASAQSHLERYHLLLAADVVYDPDHPRWLHAAMTSLLVKSPSSRAHVLNAKREQGRFGQWDLVRRTDEAFGPVWDPAQAPVGERAAPRLRVLQRVDLPKRKGLGRSDESGHVWWTLGWI
ncbi:unnamed protein product [Parajaminaea phylloscopi]